MKQGAHDETAETVADKMDGLARHTRQKAVQTRGVAAQIVADAGIGKGMHAKTRAPQSPRQQPQRRVGQPQTVHQHDAFPAIRPRAGIRHGAWPVAVHALS